MTLIVVGLLCLLFGLAARAYHHRVFESGDKANAASDPFGEAQTRVLGVILPWMAPVLIALGVIDVLGGFG